MKHWFRGKRVGAVVFFLVAGLVAGGLGYVTSAALRLEREQKEARLQADLNDQVRLAMWRLDSWIAPFLAREESRSFNDYHSIHAPPVTLKKNGEKWPAGSVLEPSSLLGAYLPDWMLLHFQVHETYGWGSPQVLSPVLTRYLSNTKVTFPLNNVSPSRVQRLRDLEQGFSPQRLIREMRQHNARLSLTDTTVVRSPSEKQFDSPMIQQPQVQKASSEYDVRRNQSLNNYKQNGAEVAYPNSAPEVALGNTVFFGENWIRGPGFNPVTTEPAPVRLSRMIPCWVAADHKPEILIVARLAEVNDKTMCQGILLHWPRLESLLLEEVRDMFPDATMLPVHTETPPHPDRTMTALPVELVTAPGRLEEAGTFWSPLRAGLVLSWAASLLALSAVGLGGWSLLDLSERRIRFVSAVTHELRTPLTTLRLYLDMLAGGMVKDEKQKMEYLQTLNQEADRLNRLVGNVLDFSRLENQRPRLDMSTIPLGEFLEEIRANWEGRCHYTEKQLVIDNCLGDDFLLRTDEKLVHQILGNLIDNACKYSKGCVDNRISLRVRRSGTGLVFEVQDCGPGIAAIECNSVFRPFRRGRGAEERAGGVGLGLPLARRWTELLKGTLTLHSPSGGGACFRLTLPC